MCKKFNVSDDSKTPDQLRNFLTFNDLPNGCIEYLLNKLYIQSNSLLIQLNLININNDQMNIDSAYTTEITSNHHHQDDDSAAADNDDEDDDDRSLMTLDKLHCLLKLLCLFGSYYDQKYENLRFFTSISILSKESLDNIHLSIFGK
ncbi:unnamed protein product [Schistosoma margrebowiei]|uniref:Uncharacterized protein n=1 Tax=Schistosoma margrebowiei TaxID=48269 RepID=A0A183ME88_9TREM|nr:unnamed protein product [Schistosoma margrebowiei]